jgi:hypothetical protein
MTAREQLGSFIGNTLLDYQEDVPWKSEFRGSSLPACQRQLMLSQFYKDEISIPRTFVQSYHFEVGRSIHRLVQATWAKQSLLWGDWQCLDRENCGSFFQNTILEKGICHRCRGPAEYVEKIIRDDDAGFTGHCDGVVWCDPFAAFLVVELKSRNHNIIKDYEGKNPYESDIYQSSAYATLIHRQYKINIAGRLILWLGKPKPRPYLSWFYPGMGDELYDSQVQAWKRSRKMIEQGDIMNVPCACAALDDVGSCPFGAICFSPNRDKLILEKHNEWFRKKCD